MDHETASKVRGIVRRVVLKNVNDDGETQTASVEVAPGIWRDKVEIMQPYGLATSAPEDGALAVAVAIGGNEDDIVLLSVGNPSARMGGLKPGETALYNQHGDGILVGADGTISIQAGASIVLKVGGVTVTVSPGGVDIDGGTVRNDGVVIDKNHIHIDVVPGGGTSGPPQS
ncbi:phage baseplate assembly protein domain-containing protein [Brucella inopinata]|uniref:Phage baseplate assembly protein n=1 Tax=Brucella inopinata TaxID=1218315 RepID=A0AAW7B3P2_9HYPH|nr:phage baseplate assembly protein [Brucella inopinata]MDL2332831.1 phage baseplate assembly protein [Brucella inopinata]